MATACLCGDPQTGPTLRDQILSWYEKLPSQTPSQILGVEPQASPEALRSAFIALARRFHPDTLVGADRELRQKCQAILARVIEAHRSLTAGAPVRRQSPPTPSLDPAARLRSAQPAAEPAPAPRPMPARPEMPPPAAPEVAPSRAPRPPEPGLVEVAIEEALACIAAGDAEGAVARLQHVTPQANRRQRRRIRITLARTYLAEARWRHTGVSLLNDILRDEPWDAEAAALLGALFRREGLLTRAEALLARAALADPGNARARAELREVRLALQQRRAREPRAGDARGLMARLLAIR